MGTTFIVLCILCLVMTVFLLLGNHENEQFKLNTEAAKAWIGIAAVILALGHLWPF